MDDEHDPSTDDERDPLDPDDGGTDDSPADDERDPLDPDDGGTDSPSDPDDGATGDPAGSDPADDESDVWTSLDGLPPNDTSDDAADGEPVPGVGSGGTRSGGDGGGAPADAVRPPGRSGEDGASAYNPEESFRRPSGVATGFDSLSRAALREHYSPVRTFFKRRGHRYQRFQRQLTQAWLRDTYDIYLARLVYRMLLIAGVATALGCLAAVALLVAVGVGPLSGLSGTFGLSAAGLSALAVGTGVGVGLIGAGGYWVWRRVFRIRGRIAARRREINYNLPYAITFMYALSRAGVSFDRILVRLADAEETYGAVSQEFDRVVRDVEMFGNNLYVGLENLRAVTPSDELRRFTDDVMTVLESGGDTSAFLRDEVEEQLDAAVEQQESFIEQLELLSEVFVVGFVAAPLFLLVVLIVVSFLGGETLPLIRALIYVVFPLALVGFMLLVDLVSQPFRAASVEFTPGRGRPSPPPESEADPAWRDAYERTKRIQGLRDRFVDELATVRENPARALLFSLPVAVAVPVIGVLLGAVPLSRSAVVANPVEVTTGLAVVPLVIAATPVAVLYEYRSRQETAFRNRFPDILDLLAVSNRRGLSLTAALAIVADSASGRIGTELERLRNDIRWNFDTAEAFEAFGDRISSPELTRTVKLIAEGSRSTSDLHAVLNVAATDTTERVRLKRQRRQTLQSYLAIVVIGFLVYLLVVLMLSVNFLDPIAAYSDLPEADTGPVSLAEIPVEQLRMLLFHSTLIQGFGSGLLAGKLAEDSLYSGLKYAIGLVVLAVAAFALV